MNKEGGTVEPAINFCRLILLGKLLTPKGTDPVPALGLIIFYLCFG